MNWYIGQEIVCVRSGKTSGLVKDKIYTILGLQLSGCKCHDVQIYVGINMLGVTRCMTCKTISDKITNEYWHSEIMFAPIEYDQNAIEELLENTLVKTN